MTARYLSALLVSALAFCTGAVGCADDTSTASNDEDVVSGKQLNGRDMADKTISLTLDDGPGERTGELADYLKAEGIRGTFFINGKNARSASGVATIKKIVANGHILANHTQNHKQLTRLSSAQVESEVAQTDAIIASVQPNGPWLVRAPFGAWSPGIADNLNRGAMRKYVGSIFWDEGGDLTSNSAADWACWGNAGLSVERCGQLYLQEIRAKRRGIILMHDIHGKTVDMIKQIVPALKAEGYRFVGLDEVPSVRKAIIEGGGLNPATGTEIEEGGEGDEHDDGDSCTVDDPDSFTNFREGAAGSRLTATVKNGTSLRVLGSAGERSRVSVEGWVTASLTSCGAASTCPATVTINDPNPARQGEAAGTNLRAAADTSSPVLAVLANGASVEVLERSGNRISVRLTGTVGAHLCR